MLPEVLIAYTTRGGSTAEIAEALGAGLRDRGVMVSVQPMQCVESLQSWTAIILGAPLYIGRFPRDLHRFLAHHREELAGLRSWFFAIGPTENKPKDFDAARQQALRQLTAYPWFHPVELRILGGRFDLQHLPFPYSLLRHLPAAAIRKFPSGDIRDWAAIRAWGQEIAGQVKPAA